MNDMQGHISLLLNKVHQAWTRVKSNNSHTFEQFKVKLLISVNVKLIHRHDSVNNA
jgi:hypothetical protein